MSTSDWVTCPVCGGTDMNKITDSEGFSLINCVNHACLSNGGNNSDAILPKGFTQVGIAGKMPGTDGFSIIAFNAKEVPVGTKIYIMKESND